MAAFLDGCRFNPAAGGTTDWTYASVVSGYQSPAAANVVNGRPYKYRAESADLGQWEFGEGAYNTATGVLARTTVLYNSSGTTSKINFSTAPQVAIVALKEDLISIEEPNSFTSAQQAQARSNIYAAPFDALSCCGMQVNGGFEIDQANVGAVVSFAAGTSNAVYVADGWVVSKQGSNAFTVQQVASAFPGYSSEIKITVTTAEASIGSDFIVLDNLVEGYRVARSGWGSASAQPISVGFWVKSSVAGYLALTIYNSSGSASANTSVTIAAANTAQFVAATFPAQTTGSWQFTTGLGFRVRTTIASAGSINLASTNGNTFEATGYIVLPGIELPASSRAPFIMRPFDQELSLCQRFYEKSYDYEIAIGTATPYSASRLYLTTGSWINPTTVGLECVYKVPKRVTPTVTLYSTGTGASGYIRESYNGQDKSASYSGSKRSHFAYVQNLTAGNGFQFEAQWVADARF